MSPRGLQAHRPPSVLVIVANLPVPLDRRVWLECQALRAAGYDVSVICPKGPGDPSRQDIDGVLIYKYAPAPQADGLAGYALEFSYSWLRTSVLSAIAWRRRRFDVLQACNPPDTFWALALVWKLRGVRFVFDQHDLNPELFLSRFGQPKGAAAWAQYKGLIWLERMSYRVADQVVSTNESYRTIAMRRGGRDGADVTVVRSGPDTSRMRPIQPDPTVRRGARHLLVYLGIMGPQDGVDVLLDVMDELVNRRGRTDVHLALLGFGDCMEDLIRRAQQLGLDNAVTFTGRAGPNVIAKYLSSADVGMCPDPKTPLNDVSTMNKTMEYMSYCLPTVAFDLKETRVSAGDAALYVPSGDIVAFATAIERLLGDEELRIRLGLEARQRVSTDLDWRPQSRQYVRVFDGLTGRSGLAADALVKPASAYTGTDGFSDDSSFVDLDDQKALSLFVGSRGVTDT